MHKHLLLLLLVVLVPYCKANVCASFSTCSNCTLQNSCFWCATSFSCKQTNESCSTDILFLDNPIFDHTQWLNCTTKIFNSSDCPIVSASLQRDFLYSTNLVGFDKAIEIKVDSKGLPIERNTTVPGVFFRQFNSYGKKFPLLFSYRKHVVFNFLERSMKSLLQNFNAFQISEDVVAIDDLRVLADDGVDFQLGYVIALYNESIEDYTCAFVESKTIAKQQSNVVSLFRDGAFWLQIPILCIALIMLSFVLLFGQSYFTTTRTVMESNNVYTKPSGHHNNIITYVFFSFVYKCRMLGVSVFNFLKTVTLTSHMKLIQSCGTDAYFFCQYNKTLILTCCLGLLITVPTFIVDITSRSNTYFLDLAGSTIASVFYSDSIWAHIVAILFIPFCFFVNRFLLKKLKSHITTEGGTVIHVIEVKKIYRSFTDENHFLKHFQQLYGQSVIGASLVFDYNPLQQAYEEKKQHVTRLEEIEKAKAQFSTSYTQKRISTVSRLQYWCCCFCLMNPLCFLCCCCGQGVSKKYFDYFSVEEETFIRKRVAELDVIITSETKHKRGTGTGYIVCSSAQSAQQIIAANNITDKLKPRKTEFSDKIGVGLAMQKAPHQSDIIYQNVGYTSAERIGRGIGAFFLLLFILFLVYMISFIISIFWFLRDNVRMTVDKAFSRIAPTDGIWIGNIPILGFFPLVSPVQPLQPIWVFNEILNKVPELIAIVNQAIPPLLAFVSSFVKYESRATQRKAYVRYNILFMFLNTVIVPHTIKYFFYYVIFWYAQEPFANSSFLYNTSGLEIVRLLMAQLTIGKSIELIILSINMIKQWIREKKLTRPDFGYEGNFAFRTICVLFLLYYGPFIPILPIFVLFYLIIQYWLDKWLIMYLYERTPDSDASIISEIQKWLTFYLFVYPFFCFALLADFMFKKPIIYIYLPIFFAIFIVGTIALFFVDFLFKSNPSILLVNNEKSEQQAFEMKLPSLGAGGISAIFNSRYSDSELQEKPVTQQDIDKALEKLKQFRHPFGDTREKLAADLENSKKQIYYAKQNPLQEPFLIIN